jgi:hypothetical protein
MTTDKLKEPFELLDEEAKEFCMKHWDCEIIDDMSSAYYDIHVYEEPTRAHVQRFFRWPYT